jgi:hypothetical protein
VFPDRPCSQEHEPELRIGSLAFAQDGFSDFTNQREASSRLVIALNIQERLDQFALIDANQVPVLALEIPNSNVRQQLKGRSKAAFGQSRAPRNSPQRACLTIEKADQAIAFT